MRSPGVRAIAIRKRQVGRKKEALRRNEGPAAQLLGEAAARVGWDHPIVVECLGVLLKIARADPGYCGRYVGFRLNAVREMLDRLIGTPGHAGGGGGNGGGALDAFLRKVHSKDFEQ